jgi:hypothetical protein
LAPGRTTITNLFEFHQLFQVANNYNKQTGLRRDKWIEAFGKKTGMRYWQTEIGLQALLARKKINASEFWRTCCFPMYPDPLPVPLDFLLHEGKPNTLNPALMIAGDPETKARIHGMSARSRSLITENRDFIHLLFKVYNHAGTVEWLS